MQCYVSAALWDVINTYHWAGKQLWVMPGCLKETVSVTGCLYSVTEEQREDEYDPDPILQHLT